MFLKHNSLLLFLKEKGRGLRNIHIKSFYRKQESHSTRTPYSFRVRPVISSSREEWCALTNRRRGPTAFAQKQFSKDLLDTSLAGRKPRPFHVSHSEG